jgi:hypothetical protein
MLMGPAFLTSKLWKTGLPCGILPKSKLVSFKTRLDNVAFCAIGQFPKKKNKRKNDNIFFCTWFIFISKLQIVVDASNLPNFAIC